MSLSDRRAYMGLVDGKCRSLVAVDGIPAVSNGGK